MCRHIVAVGVALLVTPPLSAQMDTVTSWPIGSRVRVWRSSNRNIVGYLRALHGDTLVIVAPGALRLQTRMLTDSAVRLEVSDGRRPSLRNVGVGALSVAALAVATVAVLDAASEDDCTVGGCGDTKPPYRGIALVGAAVGAAAGLLVLEDRWRAVRIPGRVSFVPSTRQIAVTLSLAFR
jgi:hypothetical protein